LPIGEVRRFGGHTRPVNDVALDADGWRAVSAGYDNSLRLWDVPAGKQLRSFPIGRECRTCALSADGKRALSGLLPKSWSS
jgi:WD40 repeat protein